MLLAHQGPLAEGEPRAFGADVRADQEQPVGRQRPWRRSAARSSRWPAPAGQRVRAAIATASPSTRNATAKCIVTTPGSSCVAMIQPPIAACATNSGSSDHGHDRRRPVDVAVAQERPAARDPQRQGQAARRGTRAAGACTRSGCGTRPGGIHEPKQLRPVGAPVAGAGRPHDPAPRDQEQDDDDGGRGEGAERALHEASADHDRRSARRRPTAWDTGRPCPDRSRRRARARTASPPAWTA